MQSKWLGLTCSPSRIRVLLLCVSVGVWGGGEDRGRGEQGLLLLRDEGAHRGQAAAVAAGWCLDTCLLPGLSGDQEGAHTMGPAACCKYTGAQQAQQVLYYNQGRRLLLLLLLTRVAC